LSQLICWAKCKYTELVVDASMEVSLEENVVKTEVYFMCCNRLQDSIVIKMIRVMGFFVVVQLRLPFSWDNTPYNWVVGS